MPRPSAALSPLAYGPFSLSMNSQLSFVKAWQWPQDGQLGIEVPTGPTSSQTSLLMGDSEVISISGDLGWFGQRNLIVPITGPEAKLGPP